MNNIIAGGVVFMTGMFAVTYFTDNKTKGSDITPEPAPYYSEPVKTYSLYDTAMLNKGDVTLPPIQSWPHRIQSYVPFMNDFHRVEKGSQPSRLKL